MSFAAQAALSHELSPAQAAPPLRMQCADRAVVMDFLAEKFNESVFSAGVTATGHLVEVLISPGGGTWTILLSSPQGVSCLFAAGQGWRRLEMVLPSPLGPPVEYHDLPE